MIITYIFTSLLCFFTFSNSVFQFNYLLQLLQFVNSFHNIYCLRHNVLPHNVRDAACGHRGGLHTLRCPLHCAAKILYELCLIGFYRRTKPSKLVIHGSISPCLGVHASAFLCSMCIIRQYLSSFAMRSCERACRSRSQGMKPLTLWQKI